MNTRELPAKPGRMRVGWALLLGALAACAPREADLALSDRARAAPPPQLSPIAGFAPPRDAGAAAAVRLGAESEALAARAAALRARATALSGETLIDEAARARLETAIPPSEEDASSR